MTFTSRMPLSSPTGAVLNVLRRDAVGPARGVVQVNHGVAEHAARYEGFADALAAHGFHVYAHDHRGHGTTTAPDAPLGHFGPEPVRAKVLADVDAVHDLIASEQPGLPVVLFGHSMGGLIALNYLAAHSQRVAAAAIWNANFSAGAAARAAQAVLAWERFRLGSDVPSRLLPKLTFQAWARRIPDRRTEFDWLSNDPAQVDAYVADPLCGFDVSVATWAAIFAFIRQGADDRVLAAIRRDLPVNLVGGDQDPATDDGRAVAQLAARLRRLGFSNLQSTIYPRTRHESLNELNRDIIVKDFVEWLDRVVPRR